MTTYTTYTFEIPTGMEKEVERRIARARKKAENLGSEMEVSYTFGRPHSVRFQDGYALRTPLTIKLPEVDLGDWTVLARADLLGEGIDGNAVITRMQTHTPIPEDAWNVSDRCDHCGWKRKRKIVYVLRYDGDDNETFSKGDVVRVGSSCLDQFVPTADLGLLRAIEAVVTWGQKLQTEAKYKMMTPEVHLVTDFVARVLDVIRRYGYKKDADQAEVNRLLSLIRHNRVMLEEAQVMRRFDGYNHPYIQLYRNTSDIAIREFNRYEPNLPLPADCDGGATVIHDWVLSLEGNTEFEKNAKSVFEQIGLTMSEFSKHKDLICNVVKAFDYFMDHGEEKFRRALDTWQAKRDEASKGHLGTVGEKISGVQVRVGYFDRYGNVWCYLGERGDGMVKLYNGARLPEVVRDVEITVSGTVKAHRESRGGNNYTILSRVKVEEVRVAA